MQLEPLVPNRQIYLPSRPKLPLTVFSYDPPGHALTAPLIVFCNGMVAPMAGWKDVIDRLGGKYRLLAFDRYGQGQSAESRLDISPAHDVTDYARYTGELIDVHLGERSGAVPLVFVGNSIGCPIIRLLAQQGLPAKTKLAGVLMNDSMIASTDFVSILPAPEEGEDPVLTQARESVRKVFHPTAPNREGIDRSKMPELMPYSDKPALPDQPFVTILAQDHELSSLDVGKNMCPGVTPELYMNYVATAWAEYNAGLVKLTTPEKARGPITVPKSNHFIQMTRPDVVAEELERIMKQI